MMSFGPDAALSTPVESWTPELRRAVMSACARFFAWSAEQQLRYRVKLPDGDREVIVAALLREHRERRPAALAKLEAHARVPLELQHRIWLPANAYELRLGEGQRIEWVERTDAGVVVHDEEPRASLWRRLLVSLLSRLPIEWLL